MSRTRHHKNQRSVKNGSDLWSRRPNSGASLNKISRDITKKKERALEKKMKYNALKGMDIRGRFSGE